MKYSIAISVLLAATALSACESPSVVAVPATQVVVPGPAGPAGAPGEQGARGNQGSQGDQGNQGNQANEGDKGETGGDTTVIVEPAPPVH